MGRGLQDVKQVKELSQLKEAGGEAGWLGSLALKCCRLIDPPMNLMSYSPQKETECVEDKANGRLHKKTHS